ncbi:MAG: hypothetical protein CBC66_000145 [Candidatus Pelagibacter sp. TMED106]|nr:MAG: hypothetical protein CBC66_000145 [Candidatus Pelagibacter sp. TMED106]
MQFSRNTSIGKNNKQTMLLIKVILFFLAIFIVVIFLNKIDFPAPNKEIEKVIPNEKLKIVK